MSTTDPTTSPYLEANFGPVDSETTSVGLEVTGSLPGELTGRLVRIGPNPIDPDASAHWFVGTGMVHGVRVEGGHADWYRSRFVRSDRVTEKMGWPPTPGPRHGMGDGTANTNVIGHAGDTWALVEAGAFPVRLSYDLETIECNDWWETLDGSFTAHPKRDPATGELHALTYYWEWDHVKYVVVGTDGRVRKVTEVAVEGGPMIHDLGLTESSVVVMDLPCTFSFDAVAEGAQLPYRWNPDRAARVGLLPRDGDGSDVVWCEVDPCYVFHPLATWDTDEGSVHMDVVQYPTMFADDVRGPGDGRPTVHRWRIDPTSGQVRTEQLDDRALEFPRHDERLTGRQVRFAYLSEVPWFPGSGERADSSGVVRLDLENSTSEVWDPGPGRFCQEPVFVPRTEASPEAEGWIMVYTHDAHRDAADVVVLAADDLAAGPVASIHLPVRVPFGFHGNWIPDPS